MRKIRITPNRKKKIKKIYEGRGRGRIRNAYRERKGESQTGSNSTTKKLLQR